MQIKLVEYAFEQRSGRIPKRRYVRRCASSEPNNIFRILQCGGLISPQSGPRACHGLKLLHCFTKLLLIPKWQRFYRAPSRLLENLFMTPASRIWSSRSSPSASSRQPSRENGTLRSSARAHWRRSVTRPFLSDRLVNARQRRVCAYATKTASHAMKFSLPKRIGGVENLVSFGSFAGIMDSGLAPEPVIGPRPGMTQENWLPQSAVRSRFRSAPAKA
jgi:hypothetical protein